MARGKGSGEWVEAGKWGEMGKSLILSTLKIKKK